MPKTTYKEDDEDVSNEHTTNPPVISGIKIGIGIVGIVLVLSMIILLFVVWSAMSSPLTTG